MDIRSVLQRRSDLSTFLVHLTRSEGDQQARARLESILSTGKVLASRAMGQAVDLLEKRSQPSSTQNCVSFTETPLEFVHLLYEEIEGRTCSFEPFGIAIPKKLGRKQGANPVWYLDITPGHDWLTGPLNAIIDREIDSGNFDESDVSKLTPFIEQMGSGSAAAGGTYQKEFWWEREWRKNGEFILPLRFICLCPEDDIDHFNAIAQAQGYRVAFLDPSWSLEEIIANLAGFASSDVRVV